MTALELCVCRYSRHPYRPVVRQCVAVLSIYSVPNQGRLAEFAPDPRQTGDAVGVLGHQSVPQAQVPLGVTLLETQGNATKKISFRSRETQYERIRKDARLFSVQFKRQHNWRTENMCMLSFSLRLSS